MAAKIRLQRKGTKNKPFYRLVAQDSRSARNSLIIEVLGIYDPLKEPSLFDVKADKVKYWLSVGAQPSDRVRILLGNAGILPKVDVAALPKRKPKKEEPAAA